MVWIWKFPMIASLTATNQSSSKLPADLFPAVLGLSMTRNLRAGYDGPWFKFRPSVGEYNYPESPIVMDSYLVKVYDQSGQNDAEQLTEVDQPEVKCDANGLPYAQFTKDKYLSVTSVASEIGKDFTLTAIGDGDFPRPMVSIEGATDSITIEPGEPTKFKFNDKTALIRNASNRVNQYTSGISASQNGDQVITIKSDGAENGQSEGVSATPSFDSFYIGRSSDRNFEGKFIELVLHVGATDPALNKVWEDACLNY